MHISGTLEVVARLVAGWWWFLKQLWQLLVEAVKLVKPCKPKFDCVQGGEVDQGQVEQAELSKLSVTPTIIQIIQQQLFSAPVTAAHTACAFESHVLQEVCQACVHSIGQGACHMLASKECERKCEQKSMRSVDDRA